MRLDVKGCICFFFLSFFKIVFKVFIIIYQQCFLNLALLTKWPGFKSIEKLQRLLFFLVL